MPNVIDPLGGSYYVEALTNKMEEGCREYFDKIEKLGGVIPAIEKGFFQRDIAKAAFRYQREIEEKKRVIVGVNDYVDEGEEVKIDLLKIGPEVEKRQKETLAEVRSEPRRRGRAVGSQGPQGGGRGDRQPDAALHRVQQALRDRGRDDRSS